MQESETKLRWNKRCLVCTKPEKGDSGFSHLYVDGGEISICCPTCMEKYLKNQKFYLWRWDNELPEGL